MGSICLPYLKIWKLFPDGFNAHDALAFLCTMLHLSRVHGVISTNFTIFITLVVLMVSDVLLMECLKVW